MDLMIVCNLTIFLEASLTRSLQGVVKKSIQQTAIVINFSLAPSPVLSAPCVLTSFCSSHISPVWWPSKSSLSNPGSWTKVLQLVGQSQDLNPGSLAATHHPLWLEHPSRSPDGSFPLESLEVSPLQARGMAPLLSAPRHPRKRR